MSKAIKEQLAKFWQDEEGASAIEYALIAAMVAVAIVSFVPQINTAVKDIFTSIRDALVNAPK